MVHFFVCLKRAQIDMFPKAFDSNRNQIDVNMLRIRGLYEMTFYSLAGEELEFVLRIIPWI